MTKHRPSDSARSGHRCANAARFGAAGFIDAPTWVTLAVVLGLGLLGSCAFGCVWTLQSEAMEDAAAERGRRLEEHLDGLIRRYAEAEFAGEGGSLAGLGRRLAAVADATPGLLDLLVVGPDRQVVERFSRHGGPLPCLAAAPPDAAMDHEHPPGAVTGEAVACKSLPVRAGGVPRGLVFYHAERDWRMDGRRLGAWVRRTAVRMGVVFAGFYVALGVLLVWASRRAGRWRARAASLERIEALGTLADGVNHEIKNPLNAVGLSLQLLARRHPDAETGEIVATARREADRIRARLEEFGRFTRLARLEPAEVDVAAFLRERFGDRIDVEGEARAEIDPRTMGRAFAAVVELIESRDVRPRLRLSTTGRRWRVAADAPAGDLDRDQAARLFDPWVRTRPFDVCSGLGLAGAAFRAHGGRLDVQVRGGRLHFSATVPRRPPRERARERR